MITEINENIVKSINDSGMAKSVMLIIDEDDAEKLSNTENMPSVGIMFNPVGIDKNLRVLSEVSLFITNCGSDDEDTVLSAIDVNTAIAKYVSRSSEYIQDCNIKTNTVRNNESGRVMVLSEVNFNIVY